MIVSPSFVIEKSLGQGRFSGLAWSFMDTPDREGDIILPSALARAVEASKAQPEIRIEHDPKQVAGVIDVMTVSDRGLEVEGQINIAQAVGRKAYDKLSDRTLGALSMGFLGSAEASGRNRVFTELTIKEISLCEEPMNAGSRVHAVKSWAQVDTERDLENLLRDVGMPNRLARKSAAIVWPAISTTEPEDARAEAIARQLSNITRSLRNHA